MWAPNPICLFHSCALVQRLGDLLWAFPAVEGDDLEHCWSASLTRSHPHSILRYHWSSVFLSEQEKHEFHLGWRLRQGVTSPLPDLSIGKSVCRFQELATDPEWRFASPWGIVAIAAYFSRGKHFVNFWFECWECICAGAFYLQDEKAHCATSTGFFIQGQC